MTSTLKYPDGLAYLSVGFVFGVLIALLLRACDHGKLAAVRPIPDTEQAENVTPLHAVGGTRRESKAS
jgi:hypothetical protein